MGHCNDQGIVLSVTDISVEQSADADGNIGSSENWIRNVGHNENVGKGSTGAKIQLEQALAIGFDASSVDSFKCEAIVVTLMNIKHAASSRITKLEAQNIFVELTSSQKT